MVTPLKGTVSANAANEGRGALQRPRYTHDAIIDQIIANPQITQRKLAEVNGYTESWLSRIMCSDAFQARLAERRTDVVDPILIADFEEKLKGLANQSLEIMAENLDASRSPKMAMELLTLTTKALGYGARPQGPAIAQTNNFVVALPPQSASATDWAQKYSGSELQAGAATPQVLKETSPGLFAMAEGASK